MPNPNRAHKTEAAVAKLAEALRDNDTYPPGHEDHYRRVLVPIEEVGITCEGCRCQIDAVDVLDCLTKQAALGGDRESAAWDTLGASWTCVDCEKGGA